MKPEVLVFILALGALLIGVGILLPAHPVDGRRGYSWGLVLLGTICAGVAAVMGLVAVLA
jgi:hypothetical protein